MNANDHLYLDPKVFDFLVQRGERFESVLERCLSLGPMATNVKGLQEVVYRYHLLGETARGYECAMMIRRKVEVLPVSTEELARQEVLLERYPTVPPRELLHVASMICRGYRKIICSPESRYRELEMVEVAPSLSRMAERL